MVDLDNIFSEGDSIIIDLDQLDSNTYGDHQNAFTVIRSNEKVFIEKNKQMAVVGQLEIQSGAAVVIEGNGQLVII